MAGTLGFRRFRRFRRVGRFGAVGAVAAAALCVSSTATAAPATIQDFVDDCADGLVSVSDTQRYVGGTAVLDGTCLVVPEPGATFVIRGATLTGAGALVVTTGLVSGADITIKVVHSTIALDGVVELAAGAAAGDDLVPEQNGTVIIRDSDISGSSVLASASFDWADGRIVIRDSTVVATTGSLTVGASELAGSDGVIRVVDSTLAAPSGDITVRTGTDFPSGDRGDVRIVDAVLDAGGATLVISGPDGRTVVRRTTIPGTPVTITTGPGGLCRTVDLTPAIACS